MILVIDNYDSFTYNLVQYIGEFRKDIKVIRNDEMNMFEIELLPIRSIIISPGPGRPENAGLSIEIVKKYYDKVPILGVCLGHQVIGEVFGGRIVYAEEIMHGKVSMIYHDGKGIYEGIESPCEATRYHSLIVDKKDFPRKELKITSKLKDGTIMGLEHKHYPVVGIQFHPESILTQHGKKMIQNFLNMKRIDPKDRLK